MADDSFISFLADEYRREDLAEAYVIVKNARIHVIPRHDGAWELLHDTSKLIVDELSKFSLEATLHDVTRVARNRELDKISRLEE